MKETLAEALAAAQADMGNALKNAKNTHFRSDYADLSAIRNAVIPHLSKHGIALVQIPESTENGISVRTLLKYRNEEMDCGTLAIAVPQSRGNPAQAMGSAISYARRYSMASICAVASSDEDDDGNSLHDSTRPGVKTAKKPAPKKQPAKKPPAKKVKDAAPFDATKYQPLIDLLASSAHDEPMQMLINIFNGNNPKTGTAYGQKWKVANWSEQLTDLFIVKMKEGEMPEVMDMLQLNNK